jgi:hypothetical protein
MVPLKGTRDTAWDIGKDRAVGFWSGVPFPSVFCVARVLPFTNRENLFLLVACHYTLRTLIMLWIHWLYLTAGREGFMDINTFGVKILVKQLA